MKKRDLLLAGLLLMGVTAFAQSGPTLNPDKDAKVIFTQTFEDDWDHWQNTPVDTIKFLEYYDTPKQGSNGDGQYKAWENRDLWKRGIFRTDSVTPGHEGGIMMFNGVKVADNMKEAGKNWEKDQYKILKDETPERAQAFALYGEDGGDNVFWYKSDSCSSSGYSDEYRRNLFVRGLDIQDNTSYRLTFFVKAKSVTGKESSPRMRAGVFRGFFRSEKPFSMGLENDNDHYKYNVPLQYEKTEFTGDWEKVTYMTYYLNDSIANDYCLAKGYWWASDSSWFWKKGSLDKNGNAIDKDLYYIVQPDKSWVRLSFSSNFTEFWLDNLSLTRSWIGGCEYYEDKMRVDFGYRTNMDTLVMNNKKITGIDQLEIPNTGADAGKYVTVWCLDTLDEWTQMPIRSAEYHSDGYMYIFTQFVTIPDPATGGTKDIALKFGDYKKVLVSFNNPTDKPNLTLKYRGTGKSPSSGDIVSPDVVFPNALDTNWIKNDRVVFNFSNEIATPNPSQKAWAGVHSLADLPPVMVKAPFEDGAFGITPANEIKFKFSREVQFDNKNTTTKAIAYVGSERWLLEWSSTDSMLVLKRDVNKTLAENANANVTAPLAGDYVITIENIAAKGTEKGDNVKFTYHFGSFDRDEAAAKLIVSDWRSEITETGDWNRPVPPSLWTYNKVDGFYQGTGKNFDNGDNYKKNGLYKMVDDGQFGNCFFYLSTVDDTKKTYGNLYTVEHLKKGNYVFTFPAFGWGRDNMVTTIYIYAKPASMIYESLEGATKTKVGEIKPTNNKSWSGNAAEKSWSNDVGYNYVKNYSFELNIAEEGDYVIEWANKNAGSQTYYGVSIGNYTLSPVGASSLYTSAIALNNAVKNARSRAALASANTAIYGGAALTKLNAKITEYAKGGSFDAAHTANQEPSVWKAAVSDISTYTIWLTSRMDTIDTEQAKIKDAEDKIKSLSDEYKQFDVTATLQAVIDSAKNKFPITEKSGKDIAGVTTALDNAIKAVDARKEKNDNLASLIENADKAVKAKERTDFEEYDALTAVLATAQAFDAIKAADAAVDEQIDAVNTATNKYLFRIEGVKAQTERLKAFRDLASELKIDAVDTLWAIKNFVDTVQTDNDEIADIYKAAVKYAILKMVADNKFEDEIDVTPFIKNYNLYATPVIAKIDVLSNADTCKKMSTEYNVINVGHQHTESTAADAIAGHKPIWIIVQDNDITNLWPGWTVKGAASGNRMYTPDNTGEEGYTKLKLGTPVFDGAVAMDWSGTADIKATVSDLPAGIYQFGVDLLKHKAKPAWGSGNTVTTFQITSKVGGKDSILKVTYDQDGRKTLLVDSMTVLNDTAQIYLQLKSNAGWSMADNFTVTYLAKHASVNYADEAAAAKTVMENKIATRKTFVNAPKAAANRVEFYNAGGQKVNAPKSGLYIKVENGVATKVFVK